jgi:hypothetical protein
VGTRNFRVVLSAGFDGSVAVEKKVERVQVERERLESTGHSSIVYLSNPREDRDLPKAVP